MKFLAIDSPVMRVLGRLGDIIILNMIFVVGCIPVITIGTSLSALYAVAMKMARGEEPSVWKEFWKAYKRNFKQATICWLIMAVVAILLFVDFRIIRVFQGSMYSVMRVILAIILGMWILMFQYLFPYIARFENTVKQTLKNAFLLMIRHLPWALLLLVILIASALSIYIIPVLLVVIPAVESIVFDFILERLFRRYMSPEDLAREEENDMYAS